MKLTWLLILFFGLGFVAGLGPAYPSNDPSMVLYLHMNNNASLGEYYGFLVDSSNHSNSTAVRSNGTTINYTSGTSYLGDGSYYCSAANASRIDIANNSGNAAYNFTGKNFTVAFWGKPTGSTSGTYRAVYKTTGNYGFRISDSVGKWSFVVGDGASIIGATASSTVDNNTWAWVVGTYNGSGTLLYVNGIFTAYAAIPNYLDDPALNITIAGSNTGGSAWRGWLDEVIIYNKSLSASDVVSLYQIYTQNRSYFYANSIPNAYAPIQSFTVTISNGVSQISNTTTGYNLSFDTSEYPSGVLTASLTCSGCNTTAIITNSSVLNTTFNVYDNSLLIKAYSESSPYGGLTFNATITNSSGGSLAYTGQTSVSTSTLTSVSNYVTVTVFDTAGLYYPRSYYGVWDSFHALNITAYLLLESEGQGVSFNVRDSLDNVLTDVLVQAYKVINGNYILIGSVVNDASGTAAFYLNPSLAYTLNFSKSGYTNASFTVVPTSQSYVITLYPVSGSGNFSAGVYQNVSFYFTPGQIYLNASVQNQEITFNILDAEAALTLWSIYAFYNGTQVGFNYSTAAAGGVVALTVNNTAYAGANRIMIVGSFTKTGFDQVNVSVSYAIGDSTVKPYTIQGVLDAIAGHTNTNLALFMGLIGVLAVAIVGTAVTGSTASGGIAGAVLFGGLFFAGFFRDVNGGIAWIIFTTTVLLLAAVIYLRRSN